MRVSKKTKNGKVRHVQAQTGANKALKDWRKISPHKISTDFVWFGQKKDANGKPKQITDLNKSFQSYLPAIEFDNREDGLLND